MPRISHWSALMVPQDASVGQAGRGVLVSAEAPHRETHDERCVETAMREGAAAANRAAGPFHFASRLRLLADATE